MFYIIEEYVDDLKATYTVQDELETNMEATLKLYRLQRRYEKDSDINFYIKEFKNLDDAKQYCVNKNKDYDHE